MDNADEAEIEGIIRHNRIIGDDLRLRGNSMVPPQEVDPVAADAVDVDHDHGQLMDMDVDTNGSDDGSAGASSCKGLAMSEVGGASEYILPLATSPAAPAPAGSLLAAQIVAGESSVDERPPLRAAESIEGETPSKNQNSHNGDLLTTGDATALSTDATGFPAEASESEANGSPRQLFADQSSSEQGQEMSADDNDDDDEDDDDDDEILSDKASSFDAQSDSDAIVSVHDDSASSQISDERAPLENAYGPFINPTDTCLEDARERLHVALEQTRLLGASFTEQAYERYRCVMKPVPDSLEEIIEPILSDPDQAVEDLLEQANAIKIEKDMEKRQAQQAGLSLEDVAYFGEGLHLVVLPEDDIDESEVDISQYPHRGPTNPETGERVEEISASAAATTEQVFERIRRIRAMRMGADISEILPEAASTQMKRNLSQDHQLLNESLPSGLAATSYLSSSPEQSLESNAGDNNHSSLQHLLTLAPDAEGIRPDGGFNAVRSALLARGVGMHEMKHDFRINPLHQRMLHPNYFPAASLNNLLPPLLGPNQLHRLKAADARREGFDFPSNARASIRSVVEEIFSAAGGSGAESAGKFVNEDDGKIDDSRCDGFGEGTSGLRRALHEGRSAVEVSLLRRMHSTIPNSNRPTQTSSTSNSATGLGSGKNNLVEHPTSEKGEVDPLLAFSVMSAVGLVRNKSSNINKPLPASHHTPEKGGAHALGLDSVSGLASVTNFFQPVSVSKDQEQCPLPDSADGAANDEKTNTKIHNGDIHDEVCLIRGGGGQEEPITIGPQTAWNDNDVTAEALTHHPQQIASLGITPSQTNVNVVEQEAAIAIIPAMLQNAEKGVTSPSDALYGTALSSINPQNPFDSIASSPFQVLSNKTQSISTLPASRAIQPMPPSASEIPQHVKTSSSSGHASIIAEATKMNVLEIGIESPAVAFSPLATVDTADSTVNGPPKRTVSHCDDFITEQSSATPEPPEGLHQDIADLIALAKFHDAHVLFRSKSVEPDTLLVKFLLSLSAAIPISKDFIVDQLATQLGSANYRSRLNEFVGCSSSATASRNVSGVFMSCECRPHLSCNPNLLFIFC